MRRRDLVLLISVVLGSASAVEPPTPQGKQPAHHKQPRHRIVSVDAPTAAEAVAKGVALRGQSRRESPPATPLVGHIDADGQMQIDHESPPPSPQRAESVEQATAGSPE